MNKKLYVLPVIAMLLFFLSAVSFANAAETETKESGLIASGPCGTVHHSFNGFFYATDGNVSYKLYEDGTMLIYGNGAMGDFYSEEFFEIDEKLMIPWYDHRADIKKVVVEKGVTSIGENAFKDCVSLGSIRLPDSILTIGNNAFYKCKELRSIVIPDSVADMGISAFEGCSNLESVVLPEKNDGISGMVLKKYLFRNCTSLKEINLPSKVWGIGFCAFSGCSSLTDLTLPENLHEIGFWAFKGCSGLRSVKDKSDYVVQVKDGAFEDCENLTSVKISKADLGRDVFKGCNNLTDVEILSAPHIGEGAFGDCTVSFADVAETETKESGLIVSGACGKVHFDTFGYFYTADNNVSYKLYEDGTMLIYGNGAMGDFYSEEFFEVNEKRMIPWYDHRGDIKKVVVENGVTSIGKNAFRDCVSLGSIRLPDSILTIGDNAFYECKGLKSIVIPDSVADMGISAFEGCSNLKSVVLPEKNDGLRSIRLKKRLFRNCTSLKKINLPSKVWKIEERAFEGCISLTGLTLPKNLTDIGSYAFKGCSGLRSVKDKSAYVVQVEKGAFEDCENLTSVKIAGGNFGSYVFKGCKNLTSVKLNVWHIGAYAFKDCVSLKKIRLPEEVSLSCGVFKGCTSLEEADIPEIYYEDNNTYASLYNELFYNCKNLKKVTVRMKSLAAIYDRVFYGCKKLESITLYSSKPPYISEHAFDRFPKGVTIYVPKGSVSIYKEWFREAGINLNKINIKAMK